MSTRLTFRMAAPSIVISLLLLTLGSIGGWFVHYVQANRASVVSLDLATIRAVEQLVFSIDEIRWELTDFLLTGDRAHLDAVPGRCEQTDRCLRETEDLVDD